MVSVDKYNGKFWFATNAQSSTSGFSGMIEAGPAIFSRFHVTDDEYNTLNAIPNNEIIYDSNSGGPTEYWSVINDIIPFIDFPDSIIIVHDNVDYDKSVFDFIKPFKYVDVTTAATTYTIVESLSDEYNQSWISYSTRKGNSYSTVNPRFGGEITDQYEYYIGSDIYSDGVYKVSITLRLRYSLSAGNRIRVSFEKNVSVGANVSHKNSVYSSATPIPDTYQCTVINGSGSGDYAENATVEITADDPEEGYEFDTWEADHSLTFVQGSYASAHALFVMPASTVTITALYKQKSDPFGPGGTSEPGGGGGTFDDTSDNIEDSSLPSLSVADTGFTTIYNPTLAQLQSLADYMWTSDSFLETIVNHAKQLLENPINAVIALNIVPCPVPDGGAQEVKVLFVPTGVTMTKAANQFVDVDCGTVQLDEYYGSAMDYSPLTEVTCYLPYIGQVTLDTDEVMGNTLQVKYRIDIVTGMCVAKIFVSGNLLYQFSGHCAINMPITSADFSSYIGAIIQAAKLVGGAIAAGAGGVAATMPTIEPPVQSTTPASAQEGVSEPLPQFGQTPEPISGVGSTSSFGELAKKAVANTVDAVMGSKTVIEHSGGFSGNSGYLAVRRPYLIIKRPRMCNPNEYGAYNGYPSMMYLNLGSCTGYTEVQEVQLTGLSATNPELSEIAQLLKAGVIL